MPMLVHRMTLVSFRLFRKNLGNLRKFFHPPPLVSFTTVFRLVTQRSSPQEERCVTSLKRLRRRLPPSPPAKISPYAYVYNHIKTSLQLRSNMFPISLQYLYDFFTHLSNLITTSFRSTCDFFTIYLTSRSP